MRLFLAINLPAGIRRKLWEAAGMLRELPLAIRWVREEKIHLTLKFIGDVDESARTRIADATAAIAASHAAPPVRIAGTGTFPSQRRPRVVWAGIEPDPRLELLHHDIEVAFEALGFEIEGKPFRPHLTLGRIRSSIDVPAARALREAMRQIRFRDEFLAESIDVMQSVPGSNYTVLHSAPMRVR